MVVKRLGAPPEWLSEPVDLTPLPCSMLWFGEQLKQRSVKAGALEPPNRWSGASF